MFDLKSFRNRSGIAIVKEPDSYGHFFRHIGINVKGNFLMQNAHRSCGYSGCLFQVINNYCIKRTKKLERE